MKKADLGLIFFSLILSLLASEFFVRFIIYDKEQRNIGSTTLFNKLLKGYDNNPSCLFRHQTLLHPHLSYIQKPNNISQECTYETSNIGLPKTHDLPSFKDDNYFHVLIIGGSVADLLARAKRGDKFLLEDMLDKQIPLPDGKKFRILNGAYGGWKMPNQLLMTIKYAQVVDMVLEIDGYNEILSYQNSQSIDSALLDIHSTKVTFSPYSKLQQYMRELIYKHPYFKNSFLIHKTYSYISDQSLKEINSFVSNYPTLNIFKQTEESFHEQFFHYLKLINLSASSHKAKHIHLLQPIRWISKKLTPKEADVAKYMSKKSIDQYMKLSLMLDKNTSYSLLDIFQENSEEIYIDHIHFNDLGSYIFAQHITNIIRTKI